MNFNKVERALYLSEEYGLKTIAQLRVFLLHCINPKKRVRDILSGIDTKSEEYLSHLWIVFKLLKEDKFDLLDIAENKQEYHTKINLSEKGNAFKRSLNLSKSQILKLVETLEAFKDQGFKSFAQIRVFYLYASCDPMTIKEAINEENTKAPNVGLTKDGLSLAQEILLKPTRKMMAWSVEHGC